MAARGRPATITPLDFSGRAPASRSVSTGDTADPAETARYVAQLSAELADMARAARLDEERQTVLAAISDGADAIRGIGGAPGGWAGD